MPSTSKAQHKFMAAVANSPSFAKKAGVPQSVGKDFTAADKALKLPASARSRADIQSINKPKTNQGRNELFKEGGNTMKIRKFNGEDDSYVEGTASSLADDANDQFRQDQTERMARLARGESATDPKSAQGKALAELTPAAEPAATPVAAAPKAKPAIVSEKQLQAFKAKYGADKELTDYMNQQQGLKRRNAPPPKVRETTVKDVFPVLTGEKKRAEEKMDKKQFRAEQNAQIIAREAARAKAKAAEEKETMKKRSDSDRETQSKPVNERFKDLFKAKESEKKTPKRAGNLTDMVGLSSRYASGGAVSASRRGDGIAQRGKTRGKMC